MRLFFLLLSLFASLNIDAQLNTANTDSTLTALLNKGVSLNKVEELELKKLGYKIQNQGFSLEETDNDYAQSLNYINKALEVWRLLKDTANEANNLKFKGYLLGHLGAFNEGKIEIKNAINLFTIKNMKFGVAVSEFDLSKVFEMEKKLDSALLYAYSSLNFWKPKNDTFRLVTINNQLLNLYCKKGKLNLARSVQVQIQKMITEKLHWRPVIDFYYLSGILGKRLSNQKLQSLYLKKYENQLNKLKEDNLIVHSQYAPSAK